MMTEQWARRTAKGEGQMRNDSATLFPDSASLESLHRFWRVNASAENPAESRVVKDIAFEMTR